MKKNLKKNLKKKLSLLLATAACLSCVSMTAFATTRYDVDVSKGDEYSFEAIKDDGETNYYVTPTSRYGTIYTRSICSASKYPAYNKLNSAGAYPYSTAVYPGASYRLQAYGITTGWNLKGRYTP